MPTASFADSVCSHRPYLLRFASRRLRDAALAEDVVQDTLLAALQAEASFGHRASLRTWLTAILQRQIADSLRRAAREPRLAFGSHDDDCADDEGRADTAAIEWIDPERRLESRQLIEALVRSLAALPPQAAQLITLREIDGCSHDEATAAVGLTPRDGSLLLYRTRSSLRSALC